MRQNEKILWRAAERIQSRLALIQTLPLDFELPDSEWGDCQSAIRRLRVAQSRGWNQAVALLRDRLEWALAQCLVRLQEATRDLARVHRPTSSPTVLSVFLELAALAGEFQAVSIDMPNKSVSVTTGPIVLEETPLGPFEIRLHWDRIGERRAYETVALNPNPASESSDTTHPHVKGEQLCEGEGGSAIDQALRSGRLTDFFQIVSQVLATYNSGSAYVSLSDWDGVLCSDCGDVARADDSSYCERCEDNLCSGCASYCQQCEATCCHSCTEPCRICDRQVCSRCQRDCEHCCRLFCAQCLSVTDLCPQCQGKHNEETFNASDNQSTRFVQTMDSTSPAPSVSAASF